MDATRTLRAPAAACALAWTTLLLAGVALAAPGDLDPSFSGDGRVRVSLSPGNDDAGRMVVQDDGKILLVGEGHRGQERDLVVARVLPGGQIDRSFGDRGKVYFGFSRRTERGAGIALQPDGRIVVTAQVEKGPNTARMMVARLMPDGSYDRSFGVAGRVVTAFDDVYLSPRAILVTRDGGIVVGGEGFVGGLDDWSERAWILARYRDDGRLDRSFGSKGRVILPLGNGLEALAEQDDGKLVAAGAAGPLRVDFAVARIERDGSLDPTFGDAGVALASFGADNDYGHAVGIDGEGRIVVAGRTWSTRTPDVALARFLPDGTLDPSFGDGGRVITAVGTSANEAYGMRIASDGRIVVAGWAIVDRRASFLVVRYLDDGSLDPSFGDGGVVVTPAGADGALATDVAFQGPDRIVVAGRSTNADGLNDVTLARYEW